MWLDYQVIFSILTDNSEKRSLKILKSAGRPFVKVFRPLRYKRTRNKKLSFRIVSLFPSDFFFIITRKEHRRNFKNI